MNLVTEEYIIYYSKLTDTGNFLKKTTPELLKNTVLMCLGK